MCKVVNPDKYLQPYLRDVATRDKINIESRADLGKKPIRTKDVQVSDVIVIEKKMETGVRCFIPRGMYVILHSDDYGGVILRSVTTLGYAGDVYEIDESELREIDTWSGRVTHPKGFQVWGYAPLLGVPDDSISGELRYESFRRATRKKKVTKRKAVKKKVTKRKAVKKKVTKRARG